MNRMFFLGSGISLSSGLPGTEEITNKLLQDDWHVHSNSTFYPGHNSPYCDEPAARCQEFLKILKDQVDQYYWQTDRRGEGNEDLYYLARQIADEELREIDNPAVYDFTARIKSDAWRLGKPLPSSEDMYCRFHQALQRNNIMVMSGYGWNDYGMSKRLIEWLQSSAQRCLYLCHEQPLEIRNKSKRGMWHRYDEFINDGRLIPIPKWPCHMSTQEIESLIGEICNKHCHQSDSTDDMGHQTVAYIEANQ
jgi:hypothetical protein